MFLFAALRFSFNRPALRFGGFSFRFGFSFSFCRFDFTTSSLDQSVESVKETADGSTLITLRNLGTAVMPVEVLLTTDDDSTKVVKLPVEIWYGGNRYVFREPPGKHIVAARVNPDGGFPDVNPSNDAWRSPATTTH